jgi:ABC-2 type transport system ATP-binding protein
LDPVGMVEVRELIKNIAKEGITVFLSSHLLFEVEQVCSYVTIINKGVALVSDTIENVSHNTKTQAIASKTANAKICGRSTASVVDWRKEKEKKNVVKITKT